jgi:hypothetical protein
VREHRATAFFFFFHSSSSFFTLSPTLSLFLVCKRVKRKVFSSSLFSSLSSLSRSLSLPPSLETIFPSFFLVFFSFFLSLFSFFSLDVLPDGGVDGTGHGVVEDADPRSHQVGGCHCDGLRLCVGTHRHHGFQNRLHIDSLGLRDIESWKGRETERKENEEGGERRERWRKKKTIENERYTGKRTCAFAPIGPM